MTYVRSAIKNLLSKNQPTYLTSKPIHAINIPLFRPLLIKEMLMILKMAKSSIVLLVRNLMKMLILFHVSNVEYIFVLSVIKVTRKYDIDTII